MLGSPKTGWTAAANAYDRQDRISYGQRLPHGSRCAARIRAAESRSLRRVRNAELRADIALDLVDDTEPTLIVYEPAGPETEVLTLDSTIGDLLRVLVAEGEYVRTADWGDTLRVYLDAGFYLADADAGVTDLLAHARGEFG
jgi:hypothetical protein